MDSSATYRIANETEAKRYSAQLDGTYLAKKEELDGACSQAWRNHSKQLAKEGARFGVSEKQGLGFSALD